jgi:hypothetical protein
MQDGSVRDWYDSPGVSVGVTLMVIGSAMESDK